ncbi:MAG TPA: hypothetical protein VF773_10960 [Verrucomicrobiae bacterium]
MKVFWTFAITAVLSANCLAQHHHVNAGAESFQAGSPLNFANGAEYTTDSGFVLPFTLAANAPYTGLHLGSLSFTALSATPDTGGPSPGHAALGSFIELQVVSLDGPAGGVFAFWEEDHDTGEPQKEFEVPVGTTTGTNSFALSESDASSGSDPYGHIHGRRFTLTHAGLYTIGFRLLDTSLNGAANGPIHTPSEIYHFYFRAGPPKPAIHSINRTASEIQLVVDTATTNTYQIETTTELRHTATNWQPFAAPVPGTGGVHTFTDTQPNLPSKFYRIRIDSQP